MSKVSVQICRKKNAQNVRKQHDKTKIKCEKKVKSTQISKFNQYVLAVEYFIDQKKIFNNIQRFLMRNFKYDGILCKFHQSYVIK